MRLGHTSNFVSKVYDVPQMNAHGCKPFDTDFRTVGYISQRKSNSPEFFYRPQVTFFSDRYLVYPHNSKLGSLRLHGLEVLHKRMEIIPPASKNTFPATFNNVHGSRIISSGILSTEWLGLASNLLGSFCDIARNLLGSFWG